MPTRASPTVSLRRHARCILWIIRLRWSSPTQHSVAAGTTRAEPSAGGGGSTADDLVHRGEVVSRHDGEEAVEDQPWQIRLPENRLFCFFFFSSRRRHTRLQGDWSSDVCSSD